MKLIYLKLCLSNYFWNVLLGLDQLLNTFLAGHPDETFSARAHRKAEAGQWFWRVLRRLINTVFFWQKNHCREAFQTELQRGHSPKEYSG